MTSLLKELKKQEFDYIIDLHNNIRTFRIKNSLRMLSFTFKKLNIAKWLMVNFKIDYLPKIHIVERYLETLKLFDIQDDKMDLIILLHRKMSFYLNLLHPYFLKNILHYV